MYSSEDIARCCTSALLLELATTPKPGLIDRNSDPRLYSQFIFSAVALHDHFRNVVKANSIGEVVNEACEDMMKWQTGGNTHLGSLLLLTPLAKAAGQVPKLSQLRTAVRKVLKKMNHVELVLILGAISKVNPGRLGRVAFLDAKSARTREIVLRRRLSVLDGFAPYVRREVVAHEYCTAYRASFLHGYRYLRKRLEAEDWNTAGVNTFLNLLKNLPDTHVSRRFGLPAARIVSKLAEAVLESGGYSTAEGRRKFEKFESFVRNAGFKPAATADLLAVSYFLLLLNGWRP
ncbi:MAG: triphosphoribosyl-dephospho-CoA synthase [Candidatus Caldarchaeum sp.]|nr:triphosphoribosyl-dephospho-CoA synthase [Candidatus Caldarchaeum sp.]